jgi:glutamate-ammonia-ligase adenylyltransferase
MFIYEDNGKTDGPEVISTTEFYLKVVETFTQTIEARREGIFQIDLRLRPYGRAGSLAVSYDAFLKYFGPEGAAWPYERQALVKLRPIAGDPEFGRRIVALRDELIYVGEPFDVSAMRAMREKQVVQLVKAGTLNAKLSAGGLVDIEYLVQGLQIAHGHRDPALRQTNTQQALKVLHEFGLLSDEEHRTLVEAYIFQRRLIDALRMVRGHAKDLTVPEPASEEFEFLARRLGYHENLAALQSNLERFGHDVEELSASLLDPARRRSV